MAPRYMDDASLRDREEEILDQALEIISKNGIVLLTMDKLVANVNYSKGTVYKHFSSKEDVLAGLCNRNMHSMMKLFVRAADINGTAREKMTAVGFAYMVSVLMSPQHFTLVMNAKTELFEAASIRRQEEHDDIDGKLLNVICEIIQGAVSSKELALDGHDEIQKISFSLWSMAFGTISLLLNGEKACSTTTGLILEDRVIANGNIVMNGWNWAEPKRDQDELVRLLKSDVFAREIDALERQNIYLRAA
jgi:AcrR family transcriptional regulator